MNDKTQRMIALALAGLLTAPVAWTNDNVAKDGGRMESPRETSKNQAREANEAAAREASMAIEAANRLDLDIRLIGPTSVKIAGQR